MNESVEQSRGKAAIYEASLAPDELIRNEAPSFCPLANQANESMIPFIRGFIARADEYQATGTIFSQAVSDFMSLLNELSQGTGRSAVRSARSIIEHAVNISDVESSTAKAVQYMDHLGFETEFSRDFHLGLDLLPKGRKKAVIKQREHRLKKVRSALDAALIRYGSWFLRGWTQENLFDRAKKFGLDYLYPAYRLSSLVIHGAPGGTLGIVRSVSGLRVHRTSALAFDLCPLAYIAGVHGMIEIVRVASRRRPDLDATPFINSLDTLRKAWPEYLDGIKKIDNRIWPRTPPPYSTAILALSREGIAQWYWYDPVTEVLIAADDPILSEDEQAQVTRFTRHVSRDPEAFFINGRRWATYHPGRQIVANPKPGAHIVPAREIMLTPDEAVGMFRYWLAPDDSPIEGEE